MKYAIEVIGKLNAEVEKLKAENARLKAETIKQIETAMPPIQDYIAKLEAENVKLKAEVQRHFKDRQDNDVGGNLIPRHLVHWWMSEHHKLELENAGLKAEVEKLTFDPLSYLDDAGEWMPRHTHLAAVQRLKAEVQARQAENSVLAVECDSLKAEVERLTLIVGDDAIDREHGMCCDASAQVERLENFISNISVEARIEALTKLNKGKWDGCPPSDEYVRQLRGNAAKEGKDQP
jgi:cell division protein FtsB